MVIEYQQTDNKLLLFIIIISIIIFTYLFDRYVNPFSINHKKYNTIISNYLNNITPRFKHHFRNIRNI